MVKKAESIQLCAECTVVSATIPSYNVGLNLNKTNVIRVGKYSSFEHNFKDGISKSGSYCLNRRRKRLEERKFASTFSWFIKKHL